MRLLLTLFTALLLVSCSTTSLRPPEVQVIDARPASMNLFQTGMEVTMQYRNEEPEPVVLSGGVHRLMLNGVDLGKGVSGDRVEIPPFATREQTIVFSVQNLQLISGVQSLLSQKNFQYELESDLHLVSGGRTKKVRVTKEGKFFS